MKEGGRETGGRTGEAGLVQRGDGAEDLFHARAEAAYPRHPVFLQEPPPSASEKQKERKKNARAVSTANAVSARLETHA